MIITGIDAKGSHINPNNSKLTEIALVLWDTVSRQPLKEFSSFVYEEGFEEIDPSSQKYCNFNSEMVKTFGEKNMAKIEEKVWEFFNASDYVFGHNITKMSRSNLDGFMSRNSSTYEDFKKLGKVWVNSTTDIEFPSHCENMNLLYLCGFHGIQNNFPRRALSDLYGIFKVASFYSFERMTELAKSELVQLATAFDIPRYEDRTEEVLATYNYYKREAKLNGFQWLDQNKCWTKNVKKILLDEGRIQYNFPTTVVGCLY